VSDLTLNSEQALYLKSLWDKFRAGDTQSFEKLAKENYRPLFNYGLRLSQDEDLIHDCIQELFLDLWEKRHRLSDAEHVRTYLLRALRNKVIKESIKLQKFREPEELGFGLLAEPTIESKLIENEVELERVQLFNALIGQLTKRQQEIIYLRFYQNMEYEEICSVMDLNKQSVANLLHRAIKEMKNNWPVSLLLILLQ
jgi:RNA polymerase sigma factor (sigma-70 family)